MQKNQNNFIVGKFASAFFFFLSDTFSFDSLSEVKVR